MDKGQIKYLPFLEFVLMYFLYTLRGNKKKGSARKDGTFFLYNYQLSIHNYFLTPTGTSFHDQNCAFQLIDRIFHYTRRFTEVVV